MKAIKIYKSGIHLGEEKIVAGNQSSGMITFTGCHLACNFCYTPETSRYELGQTYTSEGFTHLVEDLVMRGARNLNLISPSHFWGQLAKPVFKIKQNYGKLLPIVLKISGFEGIKLIESMASLGDIIVPDFKVFGMEQAKSVNLPTHYGTTAIRAIETLLTTHGFSHLNESGKLTHGLLIRHLMMPGFLDDSLEVVGALGSIGYSGYLNLMTYFIDPRSHQVTNANPAEVHLLTTVAHRWNIKVLVNGKIVSQSAIPMTKGGFAHGG